MHRYVSTVMIALGFVTGGIVTPPAAAEAAGQVVLIQRQPRPLRPWRPQERRGGYQEPAYARGYADGYMRGLDNGRDGDRYDPAGNRNYRSADQGYNRNYGSRDAYRNNYRAGFREGYEEGYRAAGRGARNRR